LQHFLTGVLVKPGVLLYMTGKFSGKTRFLVRPSGPMARF
jgi:hypothetical protein